LKSISNWLALVFLVTITMTSTPSFAAAAPAPLMLASGWQLQDAAKVSASGEQVSSAGFGTHGWYAATVPGTVLTSLVNNKVYPEPLYGENSRPEVIPESLARTSWWYRTVVNVPKSYKNRVIWLNFDGINYSSEIWVNGHKVGVTRGAFIRGILDVTKFVTPGKQAILAVLVAPQPTPGIPHEHTLRAGVGQNGGVSAADGPTFLCTIGWDWLNAVRDRATGIWQKAWLSATGPVVIKDPLVTTDLPLPRTDSSDVAVEATVENVSDQPVKGVLTGTIEQIKFEKAVTIAPHASERIRFDTKSTPALHMEHPRLWWPNGYGDPNLYNLHLAFNAGRELSSATDVSFGVRKVEYSVQDADTLTISVNGVRIFIRGGNWGLDEAMKRIPRERLDAQIHMHRLANLNLIRNWVGQSTSEDFYSLCDKYGILVWDEFFQPNPGDGPNPTDLATYIANVRDKILRFRNHPSIMLWCARNEGFPPPAIDAELRRLMAELEPTRRYQPSSTDGAGVRSHGPYFWREPRAYYKITDDYFKTETGSMSVPTLESIKGMMPEKDWNSINDDWAAHDMAKGAQRGDSYPLVLAARYGKVANLADFARKAQMMNFESYRAMYEGRNAKLFHPTTALITWMSHPAQPSFVWQLYHYDLEPSASLFGAKTANELLHIQLNEETGELLVVNNLATGLENATARVRIFNLDGAVLLDHAEKVTAAASHATSLGALVLPAELSPVYIVRLELTDASGKLISQNTYWKSAKSNVDDLTALDSIARITLAVKAEQHDTAGRRTVTVTVTNNAKAVALMTHLQLRRARSNQRVLPVFYSENYMTLVPGESRTISVDAAVDDFKGEDALVVFDGWNASVSAERFASGVQVAPNVDADPARQPQTGLPFQTEGLR